jgi:hypothetical protein
MTAWLELTKIEQELNKMKSVSLMTEGDMHAEFWKIQTEFDTRWTPEMYESAELAFERDVMCARQRALDEAHKERTGTSLI